MKQKIVFILFIACAVETAAQDRIELGWQTTRRGIVWYKHGLPTYNPAYRLSRDTNAVLWFDTTTAVRYDWDYKNDVWRAKGTFTGAVPPLPRKASGSTMIDYRSGYWIRDTFNLLHKYDSTANAWTPWGDFMFLSTVPTDITQNATHGAAKYRRSLWQDADTHLVYYWDGAVWQQFGNASGGDNWGTQVAITTPRLTGNGTSGSPLEIAQQGATTGQVFTWNGSYWAPATPTSTAQWVDTFSIVSNNLRLSLAGDNRPYSSVSLAPYLDNTDAQNLTITGSASPYTLDISGGTDVDFAAGTGIGLSETPANTLVITNTGDLSNTNEIQALTAGGAGPTSYTLDLSSGGGAVTLQEGSGIDLTRSGNTITLTNTGDLSNTNEIQTYTHSGTTSYTNTLSGGGGTFTLQTGAGVSIAHSGGTVTVANTGDLSNTNEIQVLDTFSISGNILRASLSSDGQPAKTVDLSPYVNVNTDLSFSGAGPYTLNSSTGADVTMTAGAGISLAATSGNITITNTGDLSNTNEIQALTAGGAGPTSYTLDLSAGGGAVTLQEGSGVNLTRAGNTITINSFAVAGGGGGIYGTGAAGSGNDTLPPGGSTVTIPGTNQPLNFQVNTAPFIPSGYPVFPVLKVTVDACDDARWIKYLMGKTPVDSLEIYNYDCENYITSRGTGAGLHLITDDIMYLEADSIKFQNLPAKTSLKAIAGLTATDFAAKITGTATGQVLKWNNTSQLWQLGTPTGATVADGDYGDITVIGNGTVWTVDNGVITLAKMASNSVDSTKVINYGLSVRDIGQNSATSGQVLKWNGAQWAPANDNTGSGVGGSGTANRVAYWTGASTIAADDDFKFDGAVVNIGTGAGASSNAQLNIYGGDATQYAPYLASFDAISQVNGPVYVQVSNSHATGSEMLSLNETPGISGIAGGLRRYNQSAPGGLANEIQLLNVNAGDITFLTNNVVRFRVDAAGNSSSLNRLGAGTGQPENLTSTLQTAGSYAGPITNISTAITLNDSHHTLVYGGTNNVTWTLPSPTTCGGRVYIIVNASAAATLSLSVNVAKGNGGTFNSITAGQWAYLVADATGSTWRGYKLTSL